MLPPNISAPDLITIPIADPVAGSGAIWIVPARYRVALVGVEFHLATSVAAGTRYPKVLIEHLPGGSGLVCFAGTSQALGTGMNYMAIAGLGLPTYSDTATTTFSLPHPIPMVTLGSVTIQATNIQAADQFSNILLTLMSWITG